MLQIQKVPIAILLSLSLFGGAQAKDDIPYPGFVYVEKVIPNLIVDLRYFGSDNFTGSRVNGYEANRLILSDAAVKALSGVQKQLNKYGLGLKVFDGYRPQMAVDYFVRWSKEPQTSEKIKEKYYPEIDKSQLFKLGYIAEKSGHTRGSTVDLTIISLKTKKELDMGGSFDFFGEQSWPIYSGLTSQQQANRLLLATIMKRYGFKPYDKEWWHFTLINEPYPETYFNFPVQ